MKFQISPGFTLIEVLLSISIIAIISGISIPIYQSFQTRNDLDITATTVSHALHRGQVLARASDGDTNWGIYITLGNITVYKGASYAGRDSSYDEIFEPPGNMSFSGIDEVNFDKFSGTPQQTGTITLTSTANETRNITINTEGMVSY